MGFRRRSTCGAGRARCRSQFRVHEVRIGTQNVRTQQTFLFNSNQFFVLTLKNMLLTKSVTAYPRKTFGEITFIEFLCYVKIMN